MECIILFLPQYQVKMKYCTLERPTGAQSALEKKKKTTLFYVKIKLVVFLTRIRMILKDITACHNSIIVIIIIMS